MQERRSKWRRGAGWSLALSLPLLWCHKCEPELWIFTSVQRTNPMSIKGYRAAAKQEERRGRLKETLCDVDFCVIFIAFKLAGSACWFYCGHSRFIRERERGRVNWNMIFYDVYLTQSKTTWLDAAANSADHRHNLFKQFATCMYNIDLPRLASPHCHAIQRIFWRTR